MPVQLQSLNLSADTDVWREPDTLWVQRPISRLVCRWSVKPAAGWYETPQTKQKLPPVAGSSPKAYFPASFAAESYCFIQTRFVIWSSNLNRTNLMSTQLYRPLAHHDFSTIFSGITACTYLQTEEVDVLMS